MKEITVSISCLCTVAINFETTAENPCDLTDEEIEQIFNKALEEYNPALQYNYCLEEVESIEESW